MEGDSQVYMYMYLACEQRQPGIYVVKRLPTTFYAWREIFLILEQVILSKKIPLFSANFIFLKLFKAQIE